VPKVSAPAFGIDIFWWTRPRPLCPTPNPPPQGREPRPLWPVYFLLPLLPVAYFFQSQLLPCACWEGRVKVNTALTLDVLVAVAAMLLREQNYHGSIYAALVASSLWWIRWSSGT